MMDQAASFGTTASSVSLPKSLEQARIRTLPPSAYYIPNFISEEEEAHILEKVQR